MHKVIIQRTLNRIKINGEKKMGKTKTIKNIFFKIQIRNI